MSNNINYEIKTIVAELQSMSPRTQLEIVRLCKRVAELTPDYIEDVTKEITGEQYAAFTAALNQAKTELQSQITTNANDIDALEVRTGNAEDNIDSLQTRMSTAEDNIDSVKTRMSSAETSIQSHANSIDSLETETANIDDKLETEISVRESIVETTYENTYPVANFKAFNHTLQLKGETGELLLDGEAVGGGGSAVDLYKHDISITQISGTTQLVANFTIINNNNTPINSYTLLKNYFSQFTSSDKTSYDITATGIAIVTLNPNNLSFIDSIGYNSQDDWLTMSIGWLNNNSLIGFGEAIPTTATIRDNNIIKLN